ncbi:hypothetical protein AGMMS49525_07820 [Bacteroidia bacterium]|nr:hypothetical protein AGMMS49525_07820 [Bacteroidia bacterium]
MKQTGKIAEKAQQILGAAKTKVNKYWVAVGVFLLLLLFFNENTLFKNISYHHQIEQLKAEIIFYTAEKEAYLKKLETLNSDKETLEKIAREQYRMVKPDEELFIIQE